MKTINIDIQDWQDKHMLHGELTEKILEACFEVINELGAGFLESVYAKALLIALTAKGLRCNAEAPLDVCFRGHRVGQFYADMVVEDCVIVELKAVKELLPEHKAQTINYLKATGIEVGLLVNFGNQRLQYHRLERQKAVNPQQPPQS